MINRDTWVHILGSISSFDAGLYYIGGPMSHVVDFVFGLNAKVFMTQTAAVVR